MFHRLNNSASVAAMAVASSLILTPAANAADLSASPVADWDGWYAGVHAGVGQTGWNGIFNTSDIAGGANTFDDGDSTVLLERLDATGILGGGHVGFNFQRDRMVYGFEADLSFMDLKTNAKAPSGSEEVTSDLNLLATVRGRLGITLGESRNVMVYGTAGLAFTDAKATAYHSGETQDATCSEDGGPPCSNSFDVGNVGGVVGAGVEWAVTDAIRFRGETLYHFFDDDKDIVGLGEADPGDNVGLDGIWSVRFGVSARLSELGSPADVGYDAFAGSVKDWDGWYAGVHAGVGQTGWNGIFNSSDNDPGDGDSVVLLERLDGTGILGGAHVGFNFQRDRMVYGIEGDLSLLDLKTNAKAPSGSEEVTSDLNLLATVRGRLGITLGESRNVMVYGTAGLAFTDARATAHDSGETQGVAEFEGEEDSDLAACGEVDGPQCTNSFDVGTIGGVVGAGVEWAVTDAIRFRGETLYHFFDDDKDIVNVGEADEGDNVGLDGIWSVRFGVSARLSELDSLAVAGGDGSAPSVVHWDGLYAGVHAGVGQTGWSGIFNSSDTTGGGGVNTFDDGDSTVLLDRLDGTGILGGGHVGFNFQRDRMVYGIEGDLSFVDLKTNAKAPSGSEEVTSDLNLLASVRGRLGITLGESRNVLVYGTAGLAFTDARATAHDSGETQQTDFDDEEGEDGDLATCGDVGGPQCSNSFDVGNVGGVVGAGVEWAVSDAIRFRGETLYHFFDDDKNIVNVGEADPGDNVGLDGIWSVRVGVTMQLSDLMN